MVAEHLLKDGHQLVGLARSQSSADELAQNGIEPVRGQIGDVQVVGEQARRADGVVQVSTGGFLQQAMSSAQLLIDNTAALIEALRGSGKPLVMTYGIAMYMDTGWLDTKRVVTEDDPRCWAYFYAHFEQVQRMLEAEPSVRHIGIIPSSVYGRGGGYIGSLPRLFDSVRKYGKLYAVAPGEDCANSFVHVDDLADLYTRAVRSADTRGYYIASSQIVPMIDAARWVSHAAGLGGELEFVDYPAIRKLCGRYVELDWWVNLRGSGEKAARELGWRPSHPTLHDHLASLPQPLDLSSVYPAPRRRAASDAARAAGGVAATGEV